jgi:hypothetical protein
MVYSAIINLLHNILYLLLKISLGELKRENYSTKPDSR